MSTIFICPVHVTPTKPLLPTHIRHLIFTDLIYKSAKLFSRPVHYLFDRMSMQSSQQVIKLSEYLNQNYSESFNRNHVSDFWIGKKYVEMSDNNYEISQETIERYTKKLKPSVIIILISIYFIQNISKIMIAYVFLLHLKEVAVRNLLYQLNLFLLH